MSATEGVRRVRFSLNGSPIARALAYFGILRPHVKENAELFSRIFSDLVKVEEQSELALKQPTDVIADPDAFHNSLRWMSDRRSVQAESFPREEVISSSEPIVVQPIVDPRKVGASANNMDAFSVPKKPRDQGVAYHTPVSDKAEFNTEDIYRGTQVMPAETSQTHWIELIGSSIDKGELPNLQGAPQEILDMFEGYMSSLGFNDIRNEIMNPSFFDDPVEVGQGSYEGGGQVYDHEPEFANNDGLNDEVASEVPEGSRRVKKGRFVRTKKTLALIAVGSVAGYGLSGLVYEGSKTGCEKVWPVCSFLQGLQAMATVAAEGTTGFIAEAMEAKK